jgi:hypothetical protein
LAPREPGALIGLWFQPNGRRSGAYIIPSVLIRIAVLAGARYAPRRAVDVPKSLAEMVRERLDAGILPFDIPVKLWAGMGSGQPCTACEQPILKAQVEYELQYDAADDHAPIRLHAGCHGLWEAERRRRGYRRSA